MVHPADGATLYVGKISPDSYRSIKVAATASFCGVNLKPAPGFTFGVDNKSEKYLKKFPLGFTPGLELNDGFCLYQSDAITQFISTDSFLRRDCPKANALVLQYVNFASHEINSAQTVLCYPCYGICAPDKVKSPIAKQKLEKCLDILNNILEDKTFLVGDRITLADVSVACELLLPFKVYIEPVVMAKFPHVKRWFMTIMNQPAMKQYVGEFEFCVKTKPFDSKRYYELHPKDAKTASKKEPSTKDNVKEMEPAPQKKQDIFADLPSSNFILDDFKRLEANNDPKTVTLPYLWEKFDNDGFSFWFCEYKYNDELTLGFMAKNFLRNTLEGCRCISKHLYGSFFIIGTDNNYKIQGLWLQRGQKLIFDLEHDAVFDADVFSFRKLDINQTGDKKLIEDYIIKDNIIDGASVAEFLQLR